MPDKWEISDAKAFKKRYGPSSGNRRSMFLLVEIIINKGKKAKKGKKKK